MSVDDSYDPDLPSPVLPTIRPQIVKDEDDTPESSEIHFTDDFDFSGLEPRLESAALPIEEPDLPDSESLLASMLKDQEREELPDPQALFEAMRSQQQASADPYDSDALFEQMLAREQDDEFAREEQDEETLDPMALFQEMTAREELEDSTQEDPFDPVALFERMRAQEEPAEEEPFDPLEEPFDPVALLDQMLQEEDEVEDQPFDPVALLDEMRMEEGAELDHTVAPPLPDPQELFSQLACEEDEPPEKTLVTPKVKLFHKLKAAFSKKDPSALEESSLGVEESSLKVFESPVPPPLPDAAAMFEALEVEEQLEALEQGLSSRSPAPLPELPDLDALRAELDAEMRAELEPDLLEDLSGPERFVDTVSDLAFHAGFAAPEVRPTPPVTKPLAEPTVEPKGVLPLAAHPQAGQVSEPPRQEPSPYQRGERDRPSESPLTAPASPPPSPLPPPPATPVYRPAPVPTRSTLKVVTPAAVPTAPDEGVVSRGLAKVRAWKSTVVISRVSLTLVTRQLAAMLRSGIPLHQSLAFCAESDPKAAPVLEQVVSKVESGYSLSNALREFPESFDSVYVGLVQSGEMSGRINEMLEKLADVLERELELRKRLISVVTYPAMLMAVSLLGTLGFIFFVLPQIMPLFEDLKVDLPWPTQVLMSLREVLLPLTIVSSLAAVATYAARKQIAAAIEARPSLRRQLAQLALSIPVLGPVYEKIVTSRVLYSLASMLEVGVTMTQALARSEESAGNAFVAFRLARAREDLNEGATVSEAFRDHAVFPQTALQLIIAGEESARTVEMFTFVAKSFDDEVEHALQSAAGYLEPLIMVVMGVIVGFITIAAALPTIQLLQNFG